MVSLQTYLCAYHCSARLRTLAGVVLHMTRWLKEESTTPIIMHAPTEEKLENQYLSSSMYRPCDFNQMADAALYTIIEIKEMFTFVIVAFLKVRAGPKCPQILSHG